MVKSLGNFEDIKKQLLKRKLELEEEIAEAASDSPVDRGADLADQVASSSMEVLKNSLQNAEVEEYNMVIKALEMIANGTYGICDSCEKPISEKRLSLYPNASRCLSCQEELEDKKSSYQV